MWCWPALVVLVLAVAALGLVRWLMPAAEEPVAQGEVLIGGPFKLTDQNGREVTDQEFRGRLMLVYFGYTFCPDMCPFGLTTIASALDALPPEIQDQVVPVFITIDPARDTVQVMHDYVGQFSPTADRADRRRGRRWPRRPAPTGSMPASRRVEAADGSYLVDHSTFTYLMGRDGKYLAHFGHATTPEEMAQRIEQAIRPAERG